MLESDETDLFSYVKENYGIDLVDFTDEEKKAVCEFLGHLSTIKDRREKFKYLCEQSNHPNFSAFLDCVPYKRFKEYVIRLGVGRCKAMSYKFGDMDKKLNVKSFDKGKLKEAVQSKFDLNVFYTNSAVKSILSEVYKSIDYRAKAKANDIENYFEHSSCMMTINGKRMHGVKLINKK